MDLRRVDTEIGRTNLLETEFDSKKSRCKIRFVTS